ncbi:MAG: heavy metal-responsive transcriptional regulator [Bacteriovoracia bacterium]
MGSPKKSEYSIGQLAKMAHVNVQTIRFYERRGILRPTTRQDSGYRVYDTESLKRLHFIRQAKDLGFSLKEIQSLLNLRVRSVGRCDQVRAKAEHKLKDIQQKIAHLKTLERTLKRLISDCENRVVSDCCPIVTRMEVGNV